MTRLFDVARKSDNMGRFIFAENEEEARQIALTDGHVKKIENIREVADLTDENLKLEEERGEDTLKRAIESGHKGSAVMLIPSYNGEDFFKSLFSGQEPVAQGKHAWVINGNET